MTAKLGGVAGYHSARKYAAVERLGRLHAPLPPL